MVYAISICICTYNRYDLLPIAIRSAQAQQNDLGDCEIVIVDNSPDQARALDFGKNFADFANIKYVVEQKPGLSNARNVAARASSTPIVAFMDDDAIAYPDWTREVLRAFADTGPATTIVGGRVEPIWMAPRPPWLHESMLGSLSIVDWGGDTRIAAPHEWAAGTNVAFRVDAILAHGGFPKHLGRIGSGSALLSNEEIELVDRIRAAGGKLVYAPKARVRHLVEPKRLTKAWFRKRAAWQAFSDFVMAPERVAADAKAQWPHLVKYFNKLPPWGRTLRGLAFETDDPELFQWQTSAIYVMSALLLAGFEDVDLA